MSTSALIRADFKTAPYDHQVREFETNCDAKARALLWHMRTGKTKATIDKTCHLYKAGRIDAALVLAPNGVHSNWIKRELPIHGWDSIEHTALAWTSFHAGKKGLSRVRASERAEWRERHDQWWADLEASLTTDKLAWVAFNSESMIRPDVRRAIARLKRRRRIHLIVDESSDFGTPGSQRTKMARALAARSDYRTILDGTVVTASPFQAYTQFELLQKGALGFDRYSEFKARFGDFEEFRNGRGQKYVKLKEYKNLEELRELMAPWSSVVLREDCEDMPDVVCSVRRVEPSEEQLDAYRQLHQDLTSLTVAGRDVSLNEMANRFGKLQQVFSGFVIDQYGKAHRLAGENPRLEALSEEVMLSSGKVIVWCQFREDEAAVVARLREDGHDVVEYHGGVSETDKERNLARFRDDRRVKALVGHPKSGGRGQDMSSADTIIWYSHTFSAKARAQAMERATKICGKNVAMIDLVTPGPDEYILDTVNGRLDVADMIAGRGMKEVLERVKL